MSNNNSNSSGIGFFGLLTILFVALKLTGVISWSWWIVLLPVIIPLSIGLALVAFILIGHYLLNRK